MQMSTLDSCQCSNNMTILCIWAWERFRSSVWKRLQKKNEKKKTVHDVQFPLTKKLATTQDRQILQNSDENQDCQFWILRLVVFTRFPANRDCLLKLYMLVKSARSFSRASLGKTCLHWAYFVVNWGCCDNTFIGGSRIFLGGTQGRVHPDVYWLHSSEDPTALVTFFNKHGW